MVEQIMDARWQEFSLLMRDVYVGDETDLQLGTWRTAPAAEPVVAEVPRTIPVVTQLPTMDLDAVPLEELRRLADAIVPQPKSA